MTDIQKRRILSGFQAFSDIAGLCLRAMLTVLLISILTVVLFSCIFVVYVKTNMTDNFELNLNDFTMSLSSVIYYTDPETGLYVESTTIQSTEFRIDLQYDEIPIQVEQALVAIEDHRFYKHNGVDWYRTSAALVNMFLSMRDNFGGSTITQQLIKNLTGDNEVTVQRKLEEIFRALEFERTYSKQDIVQNYLNLVFFGRRSYGIAAAADTYLGKTVSELSLAEIASLIAIPNNPSLYDPFSRPENNKKRQESILDRMYLFGYITESECKAAKAEELVFKRGEGQVQEQATYTWFEEAVYREAAADLAKHYGYSNSAAQLLLQRGGFSIYSTMNPDVQKAIDDVYTDIESLPKTSGNSAQLQSAMVIVDPYTGYIVGLSGGVGEKPADENLVFNRATMARRPPGSSIKPLSVYAPAMDAGIITPNTKYDDTADAVLAGRTDGWLPKNDDFKYQGVMTIRTAIVRSRNTIAAQVFDKLTPRASYTFMTEKLGFNLEPEDEDYAPLSIGQFTVGATVQEMASAYTMFLNSGVRIEAITYSSIRDSNGNVVLENKPTQTVAISEVTAYWMTDILHDAAVSGTGASANLGFMPTAGKTGTSGDNKDRWFCGYTPYYVCAAWSGYDTPAKITMSSGGNPSAQLWKRVMSKVHENLDYKDFPTVANTYQPPVQGINERNYTVIYKMESGTEFYTETLQAAEGAEITIEAREYEDFTIIGDKEKTIVINENESRNVVYFTYRYTPPMPSPSPVPSPTPTPTPTIDLWTPEPSPEPSSTPTPTPSPEASPDATPDDDDEMII